MTSLLWGQPMVACSSLVLTALERQGVWPLGSRPAAPRGKAADSWAPLALVPHLVLAAWFLSGLLARGAEARLFAAVLVAGTPRVHRECACACLVVLLVRLAVCGDSIASAWLPCFLFLQGLLFEEPNSGNQGLLLRSFGSSAQGKHVDKVAKSLRTCSAPSPREVRSWKWNFRLDGELLAVYSCTVHLQLSHQGFLYLSRTHLCFQGITMIARGLRFVVALDEVKDVVGSSRDVATLMFRSTIQITGQRRLATESIEIQGCEAGIAAIEMLRSKLLDTSEDEEESEESGDCAVEGQAFSIPHDVSRETISTQQSSAVASFKEGEPFRVLFEARIPGLHLAPLAEELLADEWSQGALILEHFERMGGKDMFVSPWTDDGGGDGGVVFKLREVTMQIPVPPAPMCPKTTRMTLTICVKVTQIAGGQVRIELQKTSTSHDVPFGDKFSVQEKLELAPAQDHACKGGVIFKKSGRVVFLKSCGMLQSRIRSGTATQLTRTGETLASLLRARADSTRGPEAELNPLTTTVHIFELQRRVTIFSRSWQPPFLPHDGRKRWRWVDTTYQVHPWTSANSQQAALSDTPPIMPSSKWMAESDWEVVHGSGDEDGWQYAIDFYHRDKYWGPRVSGCHVRRRLWTCVFVEMPAEPA